MHFGEVNIKRHYQNQEGSFFATDHREAKNLHPFNLHAKQERGRRGSIYINIQINSPFAAVDRQMQWDPKELH